jgi:hypothetical protein
MPQVSLTGQQRSQQLQGGTCAQRAVSNAQARELKSVFIDATGNYLKLIMHKCYANPQNFLNQVR